MKKIAFFSILFVALVLSITGCKKDEETPSYTVAFDLQGKGSSVDTLTVEDGSFIAEPTDTTEEYFVLAGWYKEPECVNQWNFNTDKVTSNITLYAKWVTEGIYTVTFVDPTNRAVMPESYTVECGSKLIKPEIPDTEEFFLYKWYKDEKRKEEWDFENDRVVENTTLYAKWKSIISGYDYYGAEIYSKESFIYGRFEARMKMAYAPGCISSMFLYYDNSDIAGGYPWNEIDIEVIGKSNQSFQTNIITGTRDSKITSEEIHHTSSTVDENYHTYTIEWTPDYVSWAVDGEIVRKTETVTDVEKNQVASLVEAESLRFNLWASSSSGWVGTMNPNNIPVAQYIDYVQVWQYKHDDETNTDVFTEKWRDDFDSFDSKRWNRGYWQMDLVTERMSNVSVEDGNLIMTLTKEPIYTKR